MDQEIQKLTNMIAKKDIIHLYNDIYEADYTVNFNQDIKLKDNVDHKIAFIWRKATNSFFNITETNSKLKYYSGTEWKTIQSPIGGYKTIDDFNTRIKSIVDNENNRKLEADTISIKTKFILKNGYRIDIYIDNSFEELLGFEKIVVGNSTNTENTTESTKVVEITLIKNVSVKCNLVSSSYLNGKKTNILYRFTIPAPLGYDFEINPKNIIWLPLSEKSFNSISFRLVDDKGKLLNLRGYVFSFLTLIRQV